MIRRYIAAIYIAAALVILALIVGALPARAQMNFWLPVIQQQGAGASCDCLTDVIASAVLELDATKADSYTGSGTSWANRVVVPADGSAQSAYNMTRGDGATSTTYPTFNGSAGDAAAYWTFDGGDNFRLASGVNTAFLNNLHKTTGGTDFWVAITIRSVDGAWANNEFIFSNISAANNALNGLALRTLSTEDIQLFQSGGASSSAAASTGSIFAIGDYIVIVSRQAGGTNTRMWINSLTATDIAQTFNASTLDPTGTFTIGSDADYNGNFMTANEYLYSLAMGNEYLDDAKAAAIIGYLETAHSRDYTP